MQKPRPESTPAWGWCLVAGLSAALTLVLYGRIASYPFLFDDIIHLRWLEGRSLASLWADARGMQHYRPLVFTLWAVSQRLFGAQNALPLHWLSLLLHAANGLLAGWLAFALDPVDRATAWVRAAVASILFVSFPLSYQVLPSPGSHSKPVSLLLILLSTWVYSRARLQKRPVLLLLAAPLAILAPFAYESAVTVGAYWVLYEWLLTLSGRARRFATLSLSALLMGVPFLIVWRLVPSSYDTVSFPGVEALWQSSVYFCQALTWPTALAARPLMRVTGLGDLYATALVSYLCLAVLGALYLVAKRGRVLLGVLGWFALSLAVQWVTLSFRYVIDGPRILYAASVAIACLWADVLCRAALAHKGQGSLTRVVGGATASVALAVMVLWSTRFIGQRLDLVDAGVGFLNATADAGESAAPDSTLLFINVPAWITVNETDFALGHEGYTLLPPYYAVGLSDFARVNRGMTRDMRMAALPDVRSPWIGNIGYHGEPVTLDALAGDIRSVDHVWVTGYAPDGLPLLDAGAVRVASKADTPLATFGDSVDLVAVSARQSESRLELELGWAMGSRLEGPYTAFVHLYASSGELITQADGYPLRGVYPFRVAEASEHLLDRRTMTLPPDVTASEAVIGIGLYRGDTGERATASGRDGVRIADDTCRLLLSEAMAHQPG